MEGWEKGITLLILLSTLFLGQGEEMGRAQHELPCHVVVGEVVDKKQIDGEFILFVIVEIDSEEIGYAITVKEETYKKHEIGEQYENITCDKEDLRWLLDTIDSLIESGIVRVSG